MQEEMLFTASLNDLTAITKEFILERVDEKNIMERYLGIPVRLGVQYRNPLRHDENPTCLFSYYRGRLYFRDWAFWTRAKDCFDIVMMKYGCSFDTALSTIATDFGISNAKRDVSLADIKEQRIKFEKNKKSIAIQSQPFTKTDVEYLKSFGITRKICEKYGVVSVKYLYIGGRVVQCYTDNDPLLAYYFGESEDGEERWKIYGYKRKKGHHKPRFYCNTNRIAGWVQMPKEGEVIVLTKSLKDVMTLDRLGIPAVAMQNETTEPYEWVVQHLLTNFDKVYSLYDFDLTGVRMGNKLKRKYGVQPIYLTNGRMDSFNWGSKDVSDFVKDNGVQTAQMVVDRLRKEHVA